MITFISVFAFVLALVSQGQQQITFEANPGEDITSESLIQIGSDFVVVGTKNASFEQALITRTNQFGVVVWSKLCPNWSRFNHVSLTRTGKILAVGDYGDDALVAVFNQDGSLHFAKSYATSNTDRWYSGTTDNAGNIYVTGHTRYSVSNFGEIFAKIDQTGTIVWSVKMSRTAYSHSARETWLRGDSLFVIGQTNSNGYSALGSSQNDISLTILNASTGGILLFRVFGTHSNENILDAKMKDGLAFVLFSDPNNTSARFMAQITLTSPNYGLVVNPVLIEPNFSTGFGLNGGGRLALDGSDVYLFGGATGTGTKRSYVAKLSQSLSMGWMKLVEVGVSNLQPVGTAGIGVGGSLAFASHHVSSSTLGSMTSSGIHTGCETPVDLLVNVIPYPLSSGGAGLNLVPLTLGVADVVFDNYIPTITPCTPSPLPVELLSFDGEKVGRTSKLSWRTATEHGVSHFNLRRSKDATEWEQIAVEPAVGESQQITSYSYVDDDPHAGINYYQLEIVDLDGSTKLSPVVVVEHVFDNDPISVYPNPAESGGRRTINGEFQEAQIFDPLGRVIGTIRNGDPLVINGAQGVYPLVVIRTDGSTETVRVVVY